MSLKSEMKRSVIYFFRRDPLLRPELHTYYRIASLFALILCLVGCSTPPLEDHGQTRFEQKQEQQQRRDLSDGERFP